MYARVSRPAIRLSMIPGETAIATLAPFLFGAANLLVICIAAGTLWLLLTGKLLPKPGPAAQTTKV